MQFSKAGLEDLQNDQACKRRREGGASCEAESVLDKPHPGQPIKTYDLGQPLMVNKDVLDDASFSIGSSQEPVHHNEHGSNGGSVAALSCEEVSNKDSGTSMPQEIRNCAPTLSIHDGGRSSKPMVCLNA